MALQKLDPYRLSTNIFDLWKNQWLVLTSGDFSQNRFNPMTVAWGSLGVIWNKLLAQVVVRPTRYTYQFIEEFDTFTLCAFPPQYRGALSKLGSTSGRDGNKSVATGLTPIAAQQVVAPAYAEAELILECKKIYWDDLEPTHFLDSSIEGNYCNDYHRVYFGEVLGVYGEEL